MTARQARFQLVKACQRDGEDRPPDSRVDRGVCSRYHAGSVDPDHTRSPAIGDGSVHCLGPGRESLNTRGTRTDPRDTDWAHR
jgi:hypothetical protein